jgi:hypothetical protein
MPQQACTPFAPIKAVKEPKRRVCEECIKTGDR